MAATARAPKQWQLTKNETLNSFTNWKENLLYTLSLDSGFSPFLTENFTWQKKTVATPTRGLQDDGEAVAVAQRLTAVQKNAKLELMLGQIANYATIISRNTIVKNSTSLNSIWVKIREHYGFQTTGSRFLDLAHIQLKPRERPEDLYQRLVSFFDDNLLTVEGGLLHHGEAATDDEELTPSLENLIVFLWLERIHAALPGLVKQRYGAELRNKTLASIKPEISQALHSLLDELKSTEEVRVMRSEIHRPPNRQPPSTPRRTNKYCCLCRTANRPGYDNHYLSQCRFLPESDRRRMKVRQVDVFNDEDDLDFIDQPTSPVDTPDTDPFIDDPPPVTRRVSARQSPHLSCFYQHYPALLCIDTGAESNLISEAYAKKVGIPIKPTSYGAAQADGKTMLKTVGETQHVQLTRGAHNFIFDALIIRDLGSDIIVGEPFLEEHDIGVRSARKQIIIKGRDIIPYAQSKPSESASARRVFTSLCRAPAKSTTILPGEFITIHAPGDFQDNETVLLEPRIDAQSDSAGQWPKIQLTSIIDGQIQVLNDTNDPILLKKNDHFCQIRTTKFVDPSDPQLQTDVQPSQPTPPQPISGSSPSSAEISIDPQNQLSSDWHVKFHNLHLQYDTLFHPSIGCYNDASGKVRARVNIGPVNPPTKKLHVPNYSQANLQLLQSRFDELEAQGVFARPEDVNVTVEHVSPSFLVRKATGGFRLVTAFTTIGQYSKTLPTVMPSVDDILRTISSWKYLITSDLRDSFYQIPLAKESMKWCATPTPYRGLRVYLRSAQGMPGSSETLEEMMCTVLGQLIQQGKVTKIADDLYVGGNTVDELYANWAEVLQALHANNLRLKASKTKIAPTSTSLLGWNWHNGTISIGAHKISPLATCPPPVTVTAMRSFLGAYKVFNRVLRGCSRYVETLEAALHGKQKCDKIIWTASLLESFHAAQSALANATTITLPHPDDQIIITHDGAQPGIGAVLYLVLNGEIKLGGFFSAKLKAHHAKWYPCEIEALSIATSVRHFGPYLRQSLHLTQILTDNKPCVQAWSKMVRGEFSASSRVATFMSVLAEYNVDVQHIKGVSNMPSDFHSHNPPTCNSHDCQVCKFVSESDSSVVRQTTIDDVLAGHKPMPYATRSSWKTLQMECPDLRRVHAHLSQGTRPATGCVSLQRNQERGL